MFHSDLWSYFIECLKSFDNFLKSNSKQSSFSQGVAARIYSRVFRPLIHCTFYCNREPKMSTKSVRYKQGRTRHCRRKRFLPVRSDKSSINRSHLIGHEGHRYHFPGNTSSKELAWQFRRPKRYGFNLWVRKIPWRAWQPIPVFLPGKSHGQRSLAGCSPQGCSELDMIEVTWHAFAGQIPFMSASCC